jgi:hypothetical protein
MLLAEELSTKDRGKVCPVGWHRIKGMERDLPIILEDAQTVKKQCNIPPWYPVGVYCEMGYRFVFFHCHIFSECAVQGVLCTEYHFIFFRCHIFIECALQGLLSATITTNRSEAKKPGFQ